MSGRKKRLQALLISEPFRRFCKATGYAGGYLLRRFVLILRFGDIFVYLFLIDVKAGVAALKQYSVELDRVKGVAQSGLGLVAHLFKIKPAGIVGKVVAWAF